LKPAAAASFFIFSIRISNPTRHLIIPCFFLIWKKKRIPHEANKGANNPHRQLIASPLYNWLYNNNNNKKKGNFKSIEYNRHRHDDDDIYNISLGSSMRDNCVSLHMTSFHFVTWTQIRRRYRFSSFWTNRHAILHEIKF
jgi:hypothetical protein